MKSFLSGPVFAALGILTALPAGAADPGTFPLGGGVGLEVERISKGRFTMGSPESEPGRNPDEKPHEVTLTRDFYLGRTAVTVAQWERFAAETGYRSEAEKGTSGGFGWNGSALEQRREFTWRHPGWPQTPEHPVVMVTWEDARQFLKWLSGRTGWTFTLPSEAQWEYACRAETQGSWWTGPDPAAAASAFRSREAGGGGTRPAGAGPANPWGLHISGNVWEWCADWFGPYDSLSGTDPLQTAAPASDKPRRVLRGGSWLRPLKDTRSAARYRNDAQSRNADNGFRVMSFGPDTGTAAGAGGPPFSKNPDAPAVPPALEPADGSPSGSAGNSSAPSPADPYPPSAPSPDPAASGGKRGGSWVPLLLIAAVLIWLARRMLRRGGNPPPAPPPGRLDRRTMRPPAPAPLSGPLNPAPGAFVTRAVEDGFWVSAGYAAGTWLTLTWLDERGQQRERRVRYEPGEDGHFIYTGSTPEGMRVSAGDGEGDGGEGGIPPLPFPLPPPPDEAGLPLPLPLPDSLSDSPRNPPGRRPPAY